MDQGTIKYGNNRDHFWLPCSKTKPLRDSIDSYPSLRRIEPHITTADVKRMVNSAIEIRKDRTRPFKISIHIVASYTEDREYTSDSKVTEIWVVIPRPAYFFPHNRLSFIHRMVIQQNIFLEMTDELDIEKIGADIMRQITDLARKEEFKVQVVHSYGESRDKYEKTCHGVGQALIKAYGCPYENFRRIKSMPSPLDNV